MHNIWTTEPTYFNKIKHVHRKRLELRSQAVHKAHLMNLIVMIVTGGISMTQRNIQLLGATFGCVVKYKPLSGETEKTCKYHAKLTILVCD